MFSQVHISVYFSSITHCTVEASNTRPPLREKKKQTKNLFVSHSELQVVAAEHKAATLQLDWRDVNYNHVSSPHTDFNLCSLHLTQFCLDEVGISCNPEDSNALSKLSSPTFYCEVRGADALTLSPSLNIWADKPGLVPDVCDRSAGLQPRLSTGLDCHE